jgi:hypothetical protein
MKTEICKLCKQEYILGFTGMIDGCDKCLGIIRDSDGYAYKPNEKFITLQDVNTGEISKRRRPA